MPKHCIPLLFLLLFPPVESRAQGSDIFPEARREALRREVVFEQPQAPEPAVTPESVPEVDLAAYRTPLIIAISGLLLAGLAFLLYRIFRDLNGTSGRQQEGLPHSVKVSELIEEELVESGVDHKLLEGAERAGQYAIAVRLLYLSLLHALTNANLIRYRRDFSNRDYLRQLDGQSLRGDFAMATRLYEQYWYGSHPIDRLSYRVVRRSVAALLGRIAEAAPTAGAND